MKSAKSYILENKQRFIDELIELLKIPSISANSNYKADVIHTADAVKNSLQKVLGKVPSSRKIREKVWSGQRIHEKVPFSHIVHERF